MMMNLRKALGPAPVADEVAVDRIRHRVLVILGDERLASCRVLQALRSRALDVVVVARQREALAALDRGESADAVLLMDWASGKPDCFVGCTRAHRAAPDCIIDCIREHPGLEDVPVLQYSVDAGQDPAPEEFAALLAAAAAWNGCSPLPARRG
jgi:hypothetical protein